MFSKESMVINYKKELNINGLPQTIELPPDFTFVILSRHPINIRGGNINLTWITYAILFGGHGGRVVISNASLLAPILKEYITIYGMAKGKEIRSREMYGGNNVCSHFNQTWTLGSDNIIIPSATITLNDVERFFTTIQISEISIFRGDVNTIKTAVPTNHVTHLIFRDVNNIDMFTLVNPVLSVGGSGVSAANHGFYWKAPTFNDYLMFPADGNIIMYGDENVAATYFSGTIRFLSL